MLFRSTPAPAPTTEEAQQAAQEAFMAGLLRAREGLAPVFDAADGMRADLITRGWSPHAAEVIALTWLQRLLINCTPILEGPK